MCLHPGNAVVVQSNGSKSCEVNEAVRVYALDLIVAQVQDLNIM